MKKKLLSIFFLALFAIALIGCDGNGVVTEEPTGEVTTETPTEAPTEEPTQAPTEEPTEGPTEEPTEAPTEGPTEEPTEGPTEEPTEVPTGEVTTEVPTEEPTAVTTEEPTTGEDPNTDTAPTFVGLFPNQSYYLGSQDYDILDGVKAMDAEDGDITADIEVYGRYTLTRKGFYEVYVGVEDSDGNYIERLVTITVKELTEYSIPDELTTEPITITLYHSNGDTISAALNSYGESFEALYPNITVVIEKSAATYDELRENTVNAIKGGTLPNIIQGYPDHVMEYIDYEAVIPLTPFIYHPTFGFNPEVVEESFLDIVLSYRQENSQYTTDGEYYSLPFNKSTEVMIYNKTLIDALIAEGVIDEIPNTWQGLFAIADDMTRVAVEDGGIIDQLMDVLNSSTDPNHHKTPAEIQAIKDNFIPISYDSPANAFITLTRQWGGQYTGLDSNRDGEILFDSPQTRAMLSYFFDYRDVVGEPGVFTIPGRWGIQYASDAFKTGQTVVTFGSTGGARYNTPTLVDVNNTTTTDDDILSFEFGVAPMPYNADMPENRTAIQQGTNMSITSAGTDQQKLASWLFLKYLTSKEVQLDFAKQTGYSPVRNTVYAEESYINFTNGFKEDGVTPEKGEMLMKAYAAQAAALQSEYLFFDQAFVGSSQVRADVEDAFGRVMLGTDGTKEQIIEDAIAAAK